MSLWGRGAAAIVLVLGASVGGVAAASAPVRAAATCHGQPATIEGSSTALIGTPGNDVIVASGTVPRVDAGEGDDLICVVGVDRKRLEVAAGPGADTVDTTLATGHTLAEMGTGADTFLGGPELDEVRFDAEAPGVVPDVVRTGDGFDFVETASAVDADLGPGDDFFVGAFPAGQSASRVVLAQGDDTLRLDMPAGSLRLDLSSGSVRQAGVESEVSGAEEVIANAPKVRVRGSRGPDDVVSGGCSVVMRGGTGNDRLTQVTGFEVSCDQHRARLYGQGGSDRLRSSSGDDVLIGGPGLDRADAGRGRDHCDAEREVSCER